MKTYLFVLTALLPLATKLAIAGPVPVDSLDARADDDDAERLAARQTVPPLRTGPVVAVDPPHMTTRVHPRPTDAPVTTTAKTTTEPTGRPPKSSKTSSGKNTKETDKPPPAGGSSSSSSSTTNNNNNTNQINNIINAITGGAGGSAAAAAAPGGGDGDSDGDKGGDGRNNRGGHRCRVDRGFDYYKFPCQSSFTVGRATRGSTVISLSLSRRARYYKGMGERRRSSSPLP
ncbi:uncharacterized protein BO97DRAFT_423745 [Aspergillus homomorphus CBS 101889]|uniref:Uncharacterized protein n=1 Tax=Aspergillus homomorphus (strain CBS 101889) TaxID=1450537 RepID=A0A395I5B8_ASPHC|nr:hypothetical protein BO97DRAFT_423745 [Aspergillus homomorphus CBS 101889]RAL13544.1 hypothetical protein BO97DRAFT_423745 [Aspergillus homomorphus CBS 101889]